MMETYFKIIFILSQTNNNKITEKKLIRLFKKIHINLKIRILNLKLSKREQFEIVKVSYNLI